MSVAAVLAGEKRWHVEASDALAFLQGLPDGCVHCACTSPPYYRLRAYLKATDPLKPLEMGQEKTPAEYVAGMVRLFRELRRVLRDDGVFWLNVGDSYAASGKSRGGNQGEKWTDHGADTVGPRGGKWSPAPAGLKPLDQCNIPHRLYIALIEDGWYGRADLIWAKKSAMPCSVKGWRWERCRIRTDKPMRTPDGTKQNEYGKNKRSAVTVADKKDREVVRQQMAAEMWSDCPGCKKCDPHGGYVLRKGSWRPTVAHEYLFMLAKSSSYFCDGDAVRTPLSPVTLARDQYSRILDDPDEQCAVQHDHETPSNPGGANPRTVFHLDATAEDVFRWLHEQDPALAETLHARWREGQGLRDVLRVGPEPLKAAHYACVDAETECLTVGGWKRYDQLTPGMPIFTYDMESQQLRIHPLLAVNTYEYKGNLFGVFGRCSNMLMTPNHRCVVFRRNHRSKEWNNPCFVNAEDVRGSMTFPVAAPLPDDGLLAPSEPLEFFELLGWVVAEGHFGDDGSVGLTQSESANPEHVKRLDELTSFFSGNIAKHSRDRDGKAECEYRIVRELRTKVRFFLPDKYRIPEHFLMLPSSYIKAFLSGFVRGDGCIRGEKRISISQRRKEPLDIVQAMYLRMGISCSLSQRGNGMWTAHVSRKDRRHFRNGKETIIRDNYGYHGIVWCPTTPTGTWVARRGGRPFITGNSYPTALITPLIRAGTSERGACPTCGSPWARVIEGGEPVKQKWGHSDVADARIGGGEDAGLRTGMVGTSKTVGWRATCDCGRANTVPCVVLDPFAGSGRTGIVARRLGLRFLGSELNPEFAEMARNAIIGDAIDAPLAVGKAAPSLFDSLED